MYNTIYPIKEENSKKIQHKLSRDLSYEIDIYEQYLNGDRSTYSLLNCFDLPYEYSQFYEIMK